MMIWGLVLYVPLIHYVHALSTIVHLKTSLRSRFFTRLQMFDSKVVADVSAVFGVASQAVKAVRYYDNLSIQLAIDNLHKSTIEVKKGLRNDKLMHRACFSRFRKEVDDVCSIDENTALLVYGPRGVGKSTMVAAALQNMNGVISVPYDGDGSTMMFFEQEIKAAVAVDALEANNARPGDKFRAIMATYQVKYSRRPIVVVELNSQVTPAALAQLLLTVKQLGFEEMLATFVVVVSASRSALGLTIGMSELRVKGYTAPDFDSNEAHQYIVRHLGCSVATAATLTEKIGTRAMHLVEVCNKCKDTETDADILWRVAAYKKAQLTEARDVLENFIDSAEATNKADPQMMLRFLQQLCTGTADLDKGAAKRAFRFITTDSLLEALSIHNAFSVDPFTSEVHMKSKFMEVAIKQHLAAHHNNE